MTAAQEQTAARVAAAHARYRNTAVELAEAYVVDQVDERLRDRFMQARDLYRAAVDAWELITADGDLDAQLHDLVHSLGQVSPRLPTTGEGAL